MELHRIKIHYVSTQYSQSNILCERFHPTVVEHIRFLNNQVEFKNLTITHKIKYAFIACNNTIHSVSKLTPIKVFYGHFKTNLTLDINFKNKIINNYISPHKEKQNKNYMNK